MRTAPRASIVGLALALGLVGPACLKDLLGSDDDNTPFMSQGLGEACRVDTECRTGLACDPATLACVIRGGAAAGDACVRSADCGPALQCAGARCVTEGEGSEGASCADLTGCRRGYACVRSAGEVLGTCQLPRGAARPTPGDGAAFEVSGTSARWIPDWDSLVWMWQRKLVAEKVTELPRTDLRRLHLSGPEPAAPSTIKGGEFATWNPAA